MLASWYKNECSRCEGIAHLHDRVHYKAYNSTLSFMVKMYQIVEATYLK